MIGIKNKTFCAFGLRGSGKSTLVNHIATHFGSKCLVYDTLDEVPAKASYDSYSPRNRYNIAELERVIKAVRENKKYSLFIIDEANRFCPPKPSPLPAAVADLNDQCRHYGLGVGYVARRPVQLNQDLTELAEYLFIFHLKGMADIAYLNNMAAGLGDAVLALPQYHFLLVSPDRSYESYTPILPDDAWLGRRKGAIPTAAATT